MLIDAGQDLCASGEII